MRNKRNSSSRSWAHATACAVFLAASVGPAVAQGVRGAVRQRNGSTVPASGAVPIQYVASRDVYRLETDRGRIEIPRRNVLEVRTVKPPLFDRVQQAVQGRQFSAAIAPLEAIMKEYRMLQWDIPAARLLTEAYLGMGQPAEAVKRAEIAIAANPGAAWADLTFARLYWKALADSKADERLSRVLQQAIEQGSRETAAAAQLARGDLEVARGNLREALVDGYLRTALLFADVKEVHPEALYKAMQTHERLGEHSHAEKLKKMLLSKYPGSSYSQRMK
jgi:tetratricopeptide (TPR) repeat protein